MKDKRMSDSTKLLWHMPKLINHFENEERVSPIHLDIGIAKFCNVRCVFCYGKFQNIQKAFIQRDALLQTIRDAEHLRVKSIAFIGDGEPTCNPYLYEALVLARDFTSIDMAMSTNGVLVDTEEKCDTILSSCTWMRFCLSAGTKEGYKKVHGVDKFDKVVENIKRIVEVKKKKGYKCEIGLQSVFVPTTMKEEMVEEAKLAVEFGVDYFVIKQCSLPDEGESGMEMFDLKEYDSDSTNETLKKCEDMSTDKTQIIVKWNTMRQKGQRPYEGCPSVPFISELSGNGDWYPCGHMFGGKEEFKDYKFGNVHEKSLKEIFYSDRYWDIIKTMRYNFNVHTQCKGACRLDATNKFCYDYLQKPTGINFI
jgi:radical SAM protein with 4Fe4S-binding SPASM domain